MEIRRNRESSALLPITSILLLVLLLGAALIFWRPLIPCPACVEHRFSFSTTEGPACPVCKDRRKMSLYQNWQACRWIDSFFSR